MLVSELFAQAGVAYSGGPDVEFNRLVEDSRLCGPGDLFVCLPFESTNTHEFIELAISQGAVGAIVHAEREIGPHRYFPKIEFNEATWKLAKVAFSNPSAKLRVTGITGTNGKTTTAWILSDALEALGRNTAYIGTLGYKDRNGLRKGTNTTPFSIQLNSEIAKIASGGTQDLVMEVSSHALAQRRVDGIEFDVGIFTNLTQDHLDFHTSMNEYGAAKARLFFDLPSQSQKRFQAVLNLTDPMGRTWAERIPTAITYGPNGMITAETLSVSAEEIELALTYEGKTLTLRNRLAGAFNVDNTLTAFAGLIALGYNPSDCADVLSHAKAAPGRFESLANDQGIHVIVDYAHTPDALERALAAARALSPRRIIALFGCGGDRDRSKRKIMAAAVGANADVIILTSDNPRTEDPMQIINDAREGLPTTLECHVVVDRATAVMEAIRMAEAGDLVFLAGKGHEDYQIIGREKVPMDDRVLARNALEALK